MKSNKTAVNAAHQSWLNGSAKSACLASLLLAGYAHENARAESIALPLFGEWVLGPGGSCNETPKKWKMTFRHDGAGNYVIWDSIECVLELDHEPNGSWFYVKNERECLKRGFPANFSGKYIEIVPGHLVVTNRNGIKHNMIDCLAH